MVFAVRFSFIYLCKRKIIVSFTTHKHSILL